MLPPKAKPDKPHAAAPAHQPDVCGLDDGGSRSLCPGCRYETVHGVEIPVPAVRSDLASIADRFDAADRKARGARTAADRERAEADRRAADAEFYAAGRQLADLLLLLFRYAIHHHPDALRLYLVELLRPELEQLANLAVGKGGRT
jgi:hypothetical protein